MATAYPSSSSSYNRLQQVFCLNWLSNCAGSKRGTSADLTAFANVCVGQVLGDASVVGLIGPWTVVWGPQVVIGPALPYKDVAANTLFIASQPGENGGTVFVVAIAGTNPDSFYGWFGEDFAVANTLPWANALNLDFAASGPNPATTSPLISQGTADGLAQLFTLTDPNNNGQTFYQFLQSQIAAAPAGPVEVIVTGHSLGGALSASVALWLADSQGPAATFAWDPNYRAIVSALPSAGAPPGNAGFALHYDAVLGPRTNRLWNALDVIPHAWELDLLNQAPHLYFPYLAPNAAVLALVTIVEGYVTASQQTYLQINRQTPALPGQVDIAATVPTSTSWQQLALDELATIIAARLAKHFGWPDSVKAALKDVILAVIAFVQQLEASNNQPLALPTLGDNLQTDEASIKSWLATLEADVQKNLQAIVAWLSSELSKDATQAGALLQELLSDAEAAFAQLASTLQVDLEDILAEATKAIGRFLQLLNAIAQQLKIDLSDVFQYVPGIVEFLTQLGIQHVPSYGQLLGVTEFTAIQKTIRASIPYPVS